MCVFLHFLVKTKRIIVFFSHKSAFFFHNSLFFHKFGFSDFSSGYLCKKSCFFVEKNQVFPDFSFFPPQICFLKIGIFFTNHRNLTKHCRRSWPFRTRRRRTSRYELLMSQPPAGECECFEQLLAARSAMSTCFATETIS